MNDLLRNAIHQLVGRGKLCAESSGNELQGSDLPASVVVSFNPSKRVRHDLARQGYTSARCFFVLPSNTSPRWLFPLGNARCALEGLQIYTPYAPVARILKGLLTLMVAARCQSFAPHKVLVASRGSLPLEALVREVTGECEAVFALSLGTPSRFRKLVIQVMRPDGEVLGYLKLPLTEAAVQRVRHEAEVLNHLSRYPALHPYIPKVLHAGMWQDGYILFQTPGPSSPGPIEFTSLHEEFLHRLRRVSAVEKPGYDLVEQVAARWQKALPQLDSKWRALGEAALASASRALKGVMIPCGIMHGDFVPWNTRVQDGRLYVFDWESSSWDEPILWDFFHFHTQVASLLKHKQGLRAAAVHEASERAVCLLYLLKSVCQLLEEKVPPTSGGFGFRQRLLSEQLEAY